MPGGGSGRSSDRGRGVGADRGHQRRPRRSGPGAASSAAGSGVRCRGCGRWRGRAARCGRSATAACTGAAARSCPGGGCSKGSPGCRRSPAARSGCGWSSAAAWSWSARASAAARRGRDRRRAASWRSPAASRCRPTAGSRSATPATTGWSGTRRPGPASTPSASRAASPAPSRSRPGSLSPPTARSPWPTPGTARIQLLLPDGSVQVVGAELYGPRGVLRLEDGSLLVADTGNRALLRFAPPRWAREEVIRFQGPVVGLASVQGLVAVALPTEGQVALIDVARGSEVRRLQVPGWRTGDQQEGYLAVLPSGDLLASAPTPGELWRLDPSGAREPLRLPATLTGVTGLAVLPDGDVLAAQSTEHRLVRVAIRWRDVPGKKRLDVLLTERGLAPSRARAQALVLAGKVRVDGTVVTKAGVPVAGDAAIELTTPDHRWVSRARSSSRPPSTPSRSRRRGSTAWTSAPRPAASPTCLLARGARRWWRSTSAAAARLGPAAGPAGGGPGGGQRAHLGPGDLPFPVDLACIDVSFISLELVGARRAAHLRSGGTADLPGQAAVRGRPRSGRLGRGGARRGGAAAGRRRHRGRARQARAGARRRGAVADPRAEGDLEELAVFRKP